MEKKEQRIQDNIIFLGNRKDVYRLYQAMDVFVLPSRVEGFGLAVVEAQICGKWIIISSAVQDEAILVKECDRMSSFKVNEWVNKIINSKGLNCEPLNKTKNYNIKMQASILENYYIELENNQN